MERLYELIQCSVGGEIPVDKGSCNLSGPQVLLNLSCLLSNTRTIGKDSIDILDTVKFLSIKRVL